MLNETSHFYNKLVLVESFKTKSFAIGWLAWVNPRDNIGERHLYLKSGKGMKGYYIDIYDYKVSIPIYNIRSISLLEIIPIEESNPNLEDHPHLVVLRNQVINCSVAGFALLNEDNSLKFWHKLYWHKYPREYDIAFLQDHIPLFYGIKEKYVLTENDRSRSSTILKAKGFTDAQIWPKIDNVYN